MDKISYFSDSCAEHDKNHKNFINFCQHHQDFNVDAEWIFLQLVMANRHGMMMGDLLNMLQNIVYKNPTRPNFELPINV